MNRVQPWGVARCKGPAKKSLHHILFVELTAPRAKRWPQSSPAPRNAQLYCTLYTYALTALSHFRSFPIEARCGLFCFEVPFFLYGVDIRDIMHKTRCFFSFLFSFSSFVEWLAQKREDTGSVPQAFRPRCIRKQARKSDAPEER